MHQVVSYSVHRATHGALMLYVGPGSAFTRPGSMYGLDICCALPIKPPTIVCCTLNCVYALEGSQSVDRAEEEGKGWLEEI